MRRKDKVSEGLPNSVPECHAALIEMGRRLETLEAELAWFRRQAFGQKSDRMPVFAAEQPDAFASLHDEPAPGENASGDQEKQPDGEAGAEAADTRHKHGRRDLSAMDNLPVKKHVVHDVAPEEKICPCCGKEKKQLPSKFSYQMGMTRPQLYRIEHEMLQYGCGDCCEAHVSTAMKPEALVERCMADESLLSEIAVHKYSDHLPLNRQENMLKRLGIDISRQTMCGWLGQAAGELKILVDEMFRLIEECRHIHIDETPTPVQAPDKTKTGYIWGIVGGQDAPFVVYRFTENRSRAGPLEFLESFKGIIQSDGYSVYKYLSEQLEVVWAACWAHVRRKFVDAYKHCSSSAAGEAVERIRALYAIERQAKSLDDDQRLQMRQEQSRPLLDSFFEWLEKLQFEVLPQSQVGKAIAYALGLRVQLCVYVDYGYVGIDNNPVERVLRPVVMGRKNWLFAGSETGGQTMAVFYSLIQSAMRHGLNVAQYLEDVMRRLPSHSAHRIRELLPDQWTPLAPTAC